MTDEQAIRALELLARLYADQMGIQNPKIIIGEKKKKGDQE